MSKETPERRPLYETEEHLQKEYEFADCLANRWSMFTWEKAGVTMGFDYWVYDDDKKLKAVCETKIRNIFSNSYVSVMISMKKFERIRVQVDMWGAGYDESTGSVTLKPVYCIYAFRFLDGDFYYRYYLPEFEKQVEAGQIWVEKAGGRTRKPRDKWDVEDIIHIARELLIPIDQKFKSGIVHGRRSRKFCEYEKAPYEIKS